MQLFNPQLYDAAALLPLAITRTLMGWMPASEARGTGLDIGCATAPMSWQQRHLRPRYQWWALDSSLSMLKEAQDRGRLAPEYQGVCAQALALPFANNSADMLFSSFALHWYSDRQRLARELYRVAKPGAELLLAVPVQGSLHSLLKSGFPIANYGQQLEFARREDWLRAFAQVGWQLEREAEQQLTEYFPSIAQVLEQLGYVGIRQSDEPSGFLSIYEQERQKYGLPVTWRMLHLAFTR